MEVLVVILSFSLIGLLAYLYRLKKNEIPEISELDDRKLKQDKIAKFMLKSHIVLKLRDYKEYISDLESKFSNDRNVLLDEFKKESAQYSKDDWKLIEDFYADDYSEIKDTRLVLYRQSTLVSLYTYLESSLHLFCLYSRKRNGFVVNVSDYRGEGIVRSKEYLEKHGVLDVSLINGSWSNLQSFNKIRNCLVHCNGDLLTYKNKKQIISIVNNNKFLSLKEESSLIITKEYVDFIINEIESFLLEVHKQIFEKNV
ncbi:hypothetical protein [Aliivibrio logei]|uniref:hypothetical protein n=1 Tax=Aliivibrio logei TaxID=688 RepID=UPI0035C89323